MTGDDHRPPKILVRVDPDLAELIPGFLKNRRKDVLALHEAVERSDFDAIRMLGHRMKGDGCGYGFDAISDIGQALEQAAKDKNEDEVRHSVKALQHYLDHVEIVAE